MTATRRIVIESERLRLVHLTHDDASWVFELVNDPDWLRYIGDRGVRDLAGAWSYLENGPIAMYAREGFGLYRVERRADGAPVGMCGLLRREGLGDVDVGFALLPSYRRRGYAREAALATCAHAASDLGLTRVAAITVCDNRPSIAVLESIRFRFDRLVRLPGDDLDLRLYLRDLP